MPLLQQQQQKTEGRHAEGDVPHEDGPGRQFPHGYPKTSTGDWVGQRPGAAPRSRGILALVSTCGIWQLIRRHRATADFKKTLLVLYRNTKTSHGSPPPQLVQNRLVLRLNPAGTPFPLKILIRHILFVPWAYDLCGPNVQTLLVPVHKMQRVFNIISSAYPDANIDRVVERIPSIFSRDATR